MTDSMKRICLVVLLVAAGSLGLGTARSSAASDPGASDAVAAVVRAHYGSPTDLFVNCPTDNTIFSKTGPRVWAASFGR